jgi:hypothetical protein
MIMYSVLARSSDFDFALNELREARKARVSKDAADKAAGLNEPKLGFDVRLRAYAAKEILSGKHSEDWPQDHAGKKGRRQGGALYPPAQRQGRFP